MKKKPSAKKGPLHGCTILDCSTLLPGPFVGKLLALQGAKVLKVESPDRPDPARDLGHYYKDLNDCKKLVLLNLTKLEDQKKFKKLVKEADGLIEGFRPSAKLKLGLDEKSLHKVNPKLCITSLVGYREDGPWKDRAGHDLNFQAVTGCLSLFEGVPGLPLADLFSAYKAAYMMAASLHAVKAGGKGRRAVVSMTDAIREAQSSFYHEYLATKEVPGPGASLLTGKFPCYRIYSTQDHHRVSVGAIEGKFWDKICQILQLPQFAGKGYTVGEEGKKIAAAVQGAFSSKPWSHWEGLFESADCCVERVLDYSEVSRLGVQP
ncbi:CoA transferase [bacterium]|jgi:crotonobetainyl-CoA:carnitine CoA-transferase CaiB-like acyl-CoA transferase|nr:CoA transferase [bacterium]